MTASAILIQFLNGLAGASSLFLVAAGLSIIFGVTRIVNFAHGSFFMLGLYVAYSLIDRFGHGTAGFWGGVALAAVAVALLGALVEMLLLRRIYAAPELLQLLATFALVLVIQDFTLWAWGPEDLLGPRAPGLSGAVDIAGHQFPQYDLFLIVLGPTVLLLLNFLLTRTRWGTLVRAATEDREMAGALGVNQKWLFTTVFALGALLAGAGGALQIPREPANLYLDLSVIADAFVVVVVGGLGSIPGAFLAALLIAEIKAFCIGIGDVTIADSVISLSKLTLVVEFVVMAVVLVLRPWGLLGRRPTPPRGAGAVERPLALPSRRALYALAACGARARPASGAGDRVFAHSPDRHIRVRPVRGQPALHHGTRRNAVLRSCGLLRPGGLRRRAAAAPRLDCRWSSRCCWGPSWLAWARWPSAGSVSGCPACISRC